MLLVDRLNRSKIFAEGDRLSQQHGLLYLHAKVSPSGGRSNASPKELIGDAFISW